MATITTTVRVKASLTRNGHRLLDRRLEEQRVLYNSALEERLTVWRMGQELVSKAHQSRQLTLIRREFREYEEVHRRVSVATLERVDKAYRTYLRSRGDVGKRLRDESTSAPLARWDARSGRWRPRFGRPRFKPAGRFRTLEAYAGKERFLRRSENGRKGCISVKGLPRMEFRWDSRIPVSSHGEPQQPLNVKISRTPRRVTVSMTYPLDDAPEPPQTTPKGPVGLHPGVVQRATATGGDGQSLLDTRRPARSPITRLQRKMSRHRRQSIENGYASWERTNAVKFRHRWNPIDPENPLRGHHGKGYHKTRLQLARLRQRETEANLGRLHEMSARLVKTYDCICVETPDIQAMTRTATDGTWSPEKGVGVQRQISRSILEQTWGILANYLEYKAERAGIRFVRVPSPYISQTCHRCGVADASSRRSRSRFKCTHCGFDGDAEENAALNVLSQGLTMLGFGAGGTPSRRRTARLPTAGLPAVASENRCG